MDVAAWLNNLGLGAIRSSVPRQRDRRRPPAEPDGRRFEGSRRHDRRPPAKTPRRDCRPRRGIQARRPPAAAGPPATLPPPALSSRPQPRSGADAERRPITVMFCDLVGSTALAARLDAEDWRNLVNAYLDEASAAVTGLGGHVLKRLGDGLMALFGYPQRAGERRRARGARGARDPARACRDQRQERRQGRAGAFRAHRPRVRAGRGRRGRRSVRRRAERRRAGAGAAEPGSVLVTANVQRQVAGLFVVEEQGRARAQGRADAGARSFASFARAAAADEAARGR